MKRLAAGVAYIAMFQSMAGFIFTNEYMVSSNFMVKQAVLIMIA